MAHFGDDLYVGEFLAGGLQGLTLGSTGSGNPTLQQGVGPAGRIFFQNFIPLTLQTNNIAALQASATGVALTLAAGTGVTVGVAPDGSGRTVYQFDVPRGVSLTSVSNLSGFNFLVTGFDRYKRQTTQLLAGPNNATVNTKKSFASVLSVVPQGTSASTVSIGSSDIFGIDYVVLDAGYIVNLGWGGVLSDDAGGTLVTADTTNPATSSTGDPRGTYKPSTSSNGVRRMVIALHLDGTQCGVNATPNNLLGVTPA